MKTSVSNSHDYRYPRVGVFEIFFKLQEWNVSCGSSTKSCVQDILYRSKLGDSRCHVQQVWSRVRLPNHVPSKTLCPHEILLWQLFFFPSSLSPFLFLFWAESSAPCRLTLDTKSIEREEFLFLLPLTHVVVGGIALVRTLSSWWW